MPYCKYCQDPDAEFYAHQRKCIECMSADHKQRRIKEREWKKKAKFTTEEDCRRWNEDPSHKLKFEAEIRHKIAIGEEG